LYYYGPYKEIEMMKKLIVAIVILGSGVGPLLAASVITRAIAPAQYTANTPVIVTLTIVPDAADVLAYAIEETAPVGWTISNVSLRGSSVYGNLIKTPLYLDAVARTLVYNATPPLSGSGSTGTQTFSGIGIFSGISNVNGVSQAIAGDTSETIAPVTPGTTTGFMNFQNVFNPNSQASIAIKYSVEGSSLDGVTLAIYNRGGTKVRDLSSGVLTSNFVQTTWDGRNSSNQIVASGTYNLLLKKGGTVWKTKIVVVK